MTGLTRSCYDGRVEKEISGKRSSKERNKDEKTDDFSPGCRVSHHGAGCSANNSSSAGQPSAQTNETRGVNAERRQSALKAFRRVTYPLEGLDDTLAMNNLTTIKTYAGQGRFPVTPKGAESFDLFINGTAVDHSEFAGKAFTVDFSALATNEINTIQVTNILPETASVNIKVDYPTVIEGTPEEVGFQQREAQLY